MTSPSISQANWQPSSRRALPSLATLVLGLAGAGCSARGAIQAVPMPHVVPHAEWQATPPVGHAADALRRNLAPGDSLRFGALELTVLETLVDTAAGASAGRARISLAAGAAEAEGPIEEGAAIRWEGYRVAVLAVRAPGELGGGLVELEVATVASLPPELAESDRAGGAGMRLRVPHEITHVTLHHSGSPEPLRPEDDPVEKLRGLQEWGARDRNWWDVPYHFLLDLDGRIYEGRDWRYMGETNTTYDPRGHLLISVLGNYGEQQPTAAQIEAIADLMAWAVATFDIPLENIGGHYDYAQTSCPGEHLRKHLEDGTLRRMVEARLRGDVPASPAPAGPDLVRTRIETPGGIYDLDLRPSGSTVWGIAAVPLTEAWRLLPRAFTALGLSGSGIVDAAGRVYGWNGRSPARIGGRSLATYLDCGFTHEGPRTSTYDVSMSLRTALSEASTGTEMRTLVEAVARPRGTSGHPVACTTTVRLCCHTPEAAPLER